MDRTPDSFEFHDHLRGVSPSICTVATGQDGKPVLDVDLRSAGKSQYQISLHYKTSGSINQVEDSYCAQLLVEIDGEPYRTMTLPKDFRTRSQELA